MVRFEGRFGTQYRTRIPLALMLQRATAAGTVQDWQLQRRDVVLYLLQPAKRRDARNGSTRIVSGCADVRGAELSLIRYTRDRYKHNWRYHKELRLWLTKEAGTEPTQKTASYERGSYM